jgi:hypothetical protein
MADLIARAEDVAAPPVALRDRIHVTNTPSSHGDQTRPGQCAR